MRGATRLRSRSRGPALTPLWATTLAVMLIGLCCSLAAWLRGGSSAAGFAALFAFGALHQGVARLAGSDWPLPADAALIGEAALFAAGAAALFALRALHRTTRERDRAEDLHWDSMELIRGMRLLAAQTDASFEDKLARMLELGAERFRLDHAIACRLGEGAPEVLAWRAPEGGLCGASLAAALAPRLRRAAEGALALDAAADAPAPLRGPFLGAPVSDRTGAPCVVAFAGARRDARFTATDKDLIGSLADWLRGELLLRGRAEQARPAAARRAPAARVRERRDLNGAVRRVEARLRALVGETATLELSLAESLPSLSPQRIPLEALVESLVVAAHGLVRGGALRVETGALCAPAEASDPAAHATLSVRARGDAVDADAVTRAFAAQGARHGGPLPLAQVETLLRRAGGDLSVQLEPGRGALLTAFLPGSAARATAAPDSRLAAGER